MNTGRTEHRGTQHKDPCLCPPSTSDQSLSRRELYHLVEYGWFANTKASLSCNDVLCVFSQLCLTVCDHMDCGPPGSSVHGIIQARILEWVAISSSRGSSQPRNWTHISCGSCIAGGIFTCWAIGEAHLSRILPSYSTWKEKHITNISPRD